MKLIYNKIQSTKKHNSMLLKAINAGNKLSQNNIILI